MMENTVIQKRPFITLSYAQSLDGSITSHAGEKIILSNHEALKMTHQLRAANDALLIGIGTVLSDDPRLTVRFAEGQNPQPVILDGRLQIPLSAKLMNRNDKKPWIFTRPHVDVSLRNSLEEKGCKVISVKTNEDNKLNLNNILEILYGFGIKNLMVEGGAGVIASFMAARLVDRLVITVSPLIIGGINPYLGSGKENIYHCELKQIEYTKMGDDFIVTAVPAWEGDL